jgi:basic membrane protein A
MRPRAIIRPTPLAALLVLATLVLGAPAHGRDASRIAQPPRAALVIGTSCVDPFERLLCTGFRGAVRRTGVTGRIISPTPREDFVETLEQLGRAYDLVIVFGGQYYEPLSTAARRQPGASFAILGTSRDLVPGRPPNVEGVVFRTSEAAYLAGWLSGRLERSRPGRDVVGVVGGVEIPSVVDFVTGFRAGVRRASPGTSVLVGYSQDFLDASKCEAIARHQIAQGAGVVFNVAGACGLGTLRAAKEGGVWGVGVDTDQSFLGPHILTSVLVHFDVGLVTLLRQVKANRLALGRDTILTLRERAVGLGRISPRVGASLRKQVARLERRIATGAIRVAGAFPDPR